MSGPRLLPRLLAARHRQRVRRSASRRRPQAGSTWPEIPGWECCGNTAAHSINRLLATALPVNELAKVEQDMKLDARGRAVRGLLQPLQGRRPRSRRDRADGGRRASRRRPRLQGRRRRRQPRRRLPRRRRARRARGQGDQAVRRPQGRPATTAACSRGRPRSRWPTTPSTRRTWTRSLKALGCEPVEWNYKTDCCGASLALTRAGHRRRPRRAASSPTPGTAAPRP